MFNNSVNRGVTNGGQGGFDPPWGSEKNFKDIF